MLIEFAKSELARIGDQGQADRDILTIIETFANQGHSGSSAAYVTGIVEKLLRYQPLTPLTGEDAEWTEVGEQDGTTLFQSKRCPSVFKTATGAYDIDRIVYEYPDGSLTQRGDRSAITFPYTPGGKRDHIRVDADGNPLGTELDREFPVVGEVVHTGGDRSEEPLAFRDPS